MIEIGFSHSKKANVCKMGSNFGSNDEKIVQINQYFSLDFKQVF